MKVDSLLEQKEVTYDLYIAAKETQEVYESVGSDVPMMLVEGAKDKVIEYAKKYEGEQAPEMWIYQDKTDANHFVALVAGDNTYYTLRIMNNKIVEQTPANSFSELLIARRYFEAEGMKRIDTRSWFSKNRRTILKWVVGGVLTAALLPLIAAIVVVMFEVVLGVAVLGGALAGAAWLTGKAMGMDGRRA